MVNQIPLDGIVDQVSRAIACISINDLNGALYNIAPAIDVVAKKYSSSKSKDSNRERIESYLNKFEKDLIKLATLGRVMVTSTGLLIFGEISTLARLVYKFIRCGQSHDSVIDQSKVYLGAKYGVSNFFIGEIPCDYKPDQHVISSAFCLGLIAIVILDPANKNRSFTRLSISNGNKTLNISEFNCSFSAFVDEYISIHSA